jgi:GcrA cell cycle regulator
MASLPPTSTPADGHGPPRTSRNKRWPCDLLQSFLALWNENKLSASQMAGRLGISRGAVLGKAHRLGLTTHRKVRQAKPRKPLPLTYRPLKTLPPVMPIMDEPAPASPEFLGLSLLELKASSCRYPHGEAAPFFFCGQPQQDGSSYCPYHHRLTHHALSAHRPLTDYIPRGVNP